METKDIDVMPEEQSRLNRRGVLGFIVWAVGGLISLAMGIPAVAYIVGPALQQEGSEEWIALGSAQKVVLGEPTLFKATIERKTGWIVNREQLSVYVFTEDGRAFVAMSNICTHLGCRVRWIQDQSQFFCPCHNAIFDKQGLVVAGPPPRPLDRFEVKVEEGQLYIKGA